MKWLPVGLYFFMVSLVQFCCSAPISTVGNVETALEEMSQVPQWHCMRYRKFELVRRCRSYKNNLRRS